MKNKKVISFILVLLLGLSLLAGCAKAPVQESAPAEEPVAAEKPLEGTTIILSTTTSTQDSGLLDFILPAFQEKTGIETKVVAVGTGKALQMGVDGEADVLLVHAKASEEEFVAGGHGVERFDVMYNDFVLIGPKDDPIKVKEQAEKDINKALTLIEENKGKFVSRGDDSGTHKLELKLWKDLGVEPAGDWYVEAGKGMGDVIMMANEMNGYTISDRATFLSMKDKIDLDIVTESDEKLLNLYGVIAVNPDKNDKINAEGAQAFIDWILSEETQAMIKEFGKDKYGQSLFVPNAK